MFKKNINKNSKSENGLSQLKRHMKIVVVGAGATGTQLTQYLVQEGHDVSLIEADEEKARHVSNRLDCLVLHGDGNNAESLLDAGILTAHALVCVTESDEINIVICGMAAALTNSEKHKTKLLKIARVRNGDYRKVEKNSDAESRKFLGVDYFIHPDIETASAVLTAISHGALGDIFGFPGTPYELGSVNVKQGSAFDGLTLTDFHLRTEGKAGIVTLVEREQEYFLPSGSTVLAAGDLIHFICEKNNMEYFFNLAGRTELPFRRIGIVGGGGLGTLIAKQIFNPNTQENNGDTVSFGSYFKRFVQKVGRQVVIVEKDYSVCKELAAKFPDALVLNEDISDENFIAEERMGNLDLIITATDNQELNIIAAIYLKSKGVRRVIALVSGAGYKTIALQLGVDVAISENSVVVDSIISQLTGGSIRGIHSLGDESVGIVEAHVGVDSRAVDRVIGDFKLSTGGIVMLVVRKNESFIPKGDYVFKAHDKVTLIVKDGDSREIEKFFGKSK